MLAVMYVHFGYQILIFGVDIIIQHEVATFWAKLNTDTVEIIQKQNNNNKQHFFWHLILGNLDDITKINKDHKVYFFNCYNFCIVLLKNTQEEKSYLKNAKYV